ncbi:MAG: hypothetical protein Q8R92_01845 [Deltaproteobacteria bacterium]|nr:hypothetical protein [Deltaproteobacteria bacterium]
MKQTLIILITAALFAGFLYYTSQLAARVTCESCIVYEGRRACAKGAAATKEEAMRQAATVACAGLTSGMTAVIACQNTVPESESCDGAEPGAAPAPAKRY